MKRTFTYALTIALARWLPQSTLAQENQTFGNVTQAFRDAKVVPDVIPVFNPSALLDVVFTDNSTMQNVNVTPGMNLTMTQTSSAPQFFLRANETLPGNAPYVLAIVDPDAPTPQNTSISQFRHFLGGGFRVDNSTSELKNTTAALSDFTPPTPPDGSDPHRYVVVVFNQPTDFDTVAQRLVNASTPRTNFNLTTFSRDVGMGNPIAGNFFLTGPNGTNGTTNTNGTSPSSDNGASACRFSRWIGWFALGGGLFAAGFQVL
ncbi:hypothetical protein PQX77_005039 [Marasmius sp. AFHP31]|nr:hypothetical protein PQX77_005039 [Marasmius sp. AFHP31]